MVISNYVVEDRAENARNALLHAVLKLIQSSGNHMIKIIYTQSEEIIQYI